MVLGVIVAILLWTPLGNEVVSVVCAVLIIFVFGVWDDRSDLSYRIKFLGQIAAAAVVVVYGDIAIHIMPFMGMDPVSGWISVPFTIFVLVAVTNAINLSDGLDGLAAGTTMFSIATVAMLAYLVNDADIIFIAMAIMGAISGFLRFNTYPARIFMGDTGSQFLGFMTGVLVIHLTQNVYPAVNPAIPLYLLGLPMFDTLFVMIKRAYHGHSPFLPDNNHVHHQLLALGFTHYEAVVSIYITQALFVIAGVMLRYQSDLLVVGSWFLANIMLAIILVLAGRYRWRAHANPGKAYFSWLESDEFRYYLHRISMIVAVTSVSLFLVCIP
jgi:UDP-GlcNAc:undecaprenyl-phosphate GlcNAc-1-phosphate transferase